MGSKARGSEDPTRLCSLNEQHEPSEDDSFTAGLCKLGARRFQTRSVMRLVIKHRAFLERKRISSSLTEGSSHTTELRKR